MSTTREIWIEKYRPYTLDEIHGHEEIISRIQRFVSDEEIPNMMFAGPAGVGKTTTATCIAHEMYGDRLDGNFLELNASDQRGIDVIRDRIKDFSRSHMSAEGIKIIFLDEADSLTDDAQAALRRTMEKYSDRTRFILSCNYSSQVIDPIQSRCAVFRFTPLSDEAVESQMEEIATLEGITLKGGAMDALVYAAQGDMRGAINGLQAAAALKDTITEDDVYEITATVEPEELQQMVRKAVIGDFEDALDILDDIVLGRGVAGGDIIDQIHNSIWQLDLDQRVAMNVINRLAEAEYRIAEGCDERLQLQSVLASISLK